MDFGILLVLLNFLSYEGASDGERHGRIALLRSRLKRWGERTREPVLKS